MRTVYMNNNMDKVQEAIFAGIPYNEATSVNDLIEQERERLAGNIMKDKELFVGPNGVISGNNTLNQENLSEVSRGTFAALLDD